MLFCSIPVESQDSIAYLFQKYNRQLFYYISKIIHDPKLQEDALQESFYIISKNYNKIKDLDSAETRNYLYTIVKTTSLKIYNKEKLYNCMEFNENIIDFNINELSVDSIIVNTDLKILLKCALSELSNTDKDLIIMRYYLDLNIKEISELLSVKENTVSQIILRAKQRLVKIIAKKEAEK